MSYKHHKINIQKRTWNHPQRGSYFSQNHLYSQIAEARRLQVILGFPVSFSSHLQSLCSDHQVLQICHKAYLMFSLHLAARVRLLISKPDITSLLKTFGRLPIAPGKNFTASQTLYGVTAQQPLGTYSAILPLAPPTAAMREFPCFQGYLKLLLLVCTLWEIIFPNTQPVSLLMF